MVGRNFKLRLSSWFTRKMSDSAHPFDRRDGSIWYNGSAMPWRDAKLHVMSHGLHYASCVFEGIRAYRGEPYKLQEHYERFHLSANLLDFQIPYSVPALEQATRELLKDNDLSEAYIRPVAWRGSEQMAIAADKTTIHVAIIAWNFGDYFGGRLKGISLTLSGWRRPSPESAPCNSKAAGLYTICTLAKHEAQRKGFDDALMLDYRGQIAESTGANIFLVIDGQLHTPKADCFLDGITRQTIVRLAREDGIEVVERAVMLEDLDKADEVFLTGTAAEVTLVRTIDERTFAKDTIAQRLAALYDAEVRP